MLLLLLLSLRLHTGAVSGCLSLSGHVTQQQTCGNCSDAVRLKASPEPQRKQQKQTLEQPQNVDTNPCICQADLDLLKTALSLGAETCHHTTYCSGERARQMGLTLVSGVTPADLLQRPWWRFRGAQHTRCCSESGGGARRSQSRSQS